MEKTMQNTMQNVEKSAAVRKLTDDEIEAVAGGADHAPTYGCKSKGSCDTLWSMDTVYNWYRKTFLS
jgi:hypothetical protein